MDLQLVQLVNIWVKYYIVTQQISVVLLDVIRVFVCKITIFFLPVIPCLRLCRLCYLVVPTKLTVTPTGEQTIIASFLLVSFRCYFMLDDF